MSCGDPHETPCSEVISDVYFYLDSECDEVGKAKIKQHLDECNPCLREYGIEQEVKALVARCCRGEVAPDAVRERLKAKIHELVDVEAADVTRFSATRIEIRER